MNERKDNIYIYLWEELNTIYIGRTINPKSRHYQHRHKESEKTYQFSSEHHVEHPKMVIIENDLTIEEGLEREKYWIEYYKKNSSYEVLNKTIGGGVCNISTITEEERKKRKLIQKYKARQRTKKWVDNNKEDKKIKDKLYREANKEKLKEYNKKYREINKEKLKEYGKNYRQINKEKIKLYKENNKTEFAIKNKEYRETHKDKINLKAKTYRETHKDEIKLRAKLYYEAHKDKIKKYNELNKDKRKEYKKEYNIKNREKINAYSKEYYKRKNKNNVL